ncbi:hypothetical protein B0H16DRAFT_1455838 [Mycena metata]|uniref:Uncharacterized protein n=1 Tax=Mycena metata TaxID=1033252 RepID=A0AAD7JFD1_9AGAR|nr:hypothetical protein B0H16DRAFT_1455838 [Mycena metata]
MFTANPMTYWIPSQLGRQFSQLFRKRNTNISPPLLLRGSGFMIQRTYFPYTTVLLRGGAYSGRGRDEGGFTTQVYGGGARYLDRVSSAMLLDPSLFKSVQTMQFVGSFVLRSAIHPDYQLRFATAVKELFAAGDITLLRMFPTLTIWRPYQADGGWLNPYAWLDDLQAREILQDTLRTYLPNTEAAAPESELFAQIQEIVTQLDKIHSPGQIDAQAGLI